MNKVLTVLISLLVVNQIKDLGIKLSSNLLFDILIIIFKLFVQRRV